MPNGNIHKKGFIPEPPEGCDLSRERILLHCCCAPCSTAIIEWMVGVGLHPGIFFSNSNIVPFREYAIRHDELCRYAAAHGLETIDDEYDHAAWLAFVRRLETPLGSTTSLTESTLSVAEPAEAPRGLEADCSMGARSLRHFNKLSASQAQGPKINAQGPVIRIADMPERGPRCLECFKFRLLRAARYASTHGYTLLTTTLASSRWKDLGQVDAAGQWACEKVNTYPASSLSTPCSDGIMANVIQSQTSHVLWWNQNWRRGGLQERRNALIKEWDMYNQTFCGCEFSERH